MKPWIKRAVRAATRPLGYEVVPMRSGSTSLQARMLANVHLVVDVGGNVGQFGDRVRALGFDGNIVSFEPQVDAFQHLQRRSLSDARWTVRNVALGAAPGVAQLYRSKNSVSSSLHRVLPEHVNAAPRARAVSVESVQMSTLDSEFPALDEGASVYLKLDVQGHELPALIGAASLLDVCTAVQVELSFAALYEGQSYWLDVCKYLMEAGLRLAYMEPGFEDKTLGEMQQADAIFIR